MITIDYSKAIAALIRRAEDDRGREPDSRTIRPLSVLITDLTKAAAWAGYYCLAPAVTPGPPAELKSELVNEPKATPGEGSAP